METEKLHRPARVPPAVDGLQVNFCRNVTCANFGVPPGQGRHSRKNTEEPPYKMSGGGVSALVAVCGLCDESFPPKSNSAVIEEVDRLSAYLAPPPDPACPELNCPQHHLGPRSHPRAYHAYGRTSAGSPRFRCKSCGKLFSNPVSTTLRQKRPEINAMVYRLLINKMPMRRICETAGIGIQTLYTKLEFTVPCGTAKPEIGMSSDQMDMLPRPCVSRFSLSNARYSSALPAENSGLNLAIGR